MSSETKKAAYRWVDGAIRQRFYEEGVADAAHHARVMYPHDVMAEVERIRDAMAAAGEIPIAKPDEETP